VLLWFSQGQKKTTLFQKSKILERFRNVHYLPVVLYLNSELSQKQRGTFPDKRKERDLHRGEEHITIASPL
jgi:hypothetical protein